MGSYKPVSVNWNQLNGLFARMYFSVMQFSIIKIDFLPQFVLRGGGSSSKEIIYSACYILLCMRLAKLINC